MTLQELNNLSEEDCLQALQQCCTASSWMKGVCESRPFNSFNELIDKSDEVWSGIDYAGWMEACEGHPKIGDVNSLAKKYAHTKSMAGSEQCGMDSASMQVIEELAKGNQDYEDKFGFIFIVCASGKTAEEMLEILQKRLPNSKEEELKIAMREQNKITQLRLKKLMNISE